MSFSLIAVTGKYKKEDGSPASGIVTFRLTAPLQDASTNDIRAAVPIVAVLDVNGQIALNLVATNDPTSLPVGVTYTVTEELTTAPKRVYQMELPYNAAGATFDMADVVPATTVAVGDSEFQAFKKQVPTLEELEQRAGLPTSIAATTTVYIGSTNLPLRLAALTLSFSAAIAASDVNYWTFDLQRIRAGGTPVTLVTQNTKATGGIAIGANTGWDFDNAIWPSVLRYLKKGDVLRLVMTKTGAPANLDNGFVAFRYEPSVLSLVYDSFLRADSDLLGNAESGQAWSVFPSSATQSVFGIRTNQAAVVTTNVGVRDIAVVDAGIPDCSVSAVLLNVNNSGVALRMASTATNLYNGYIHNAVNFFRADLGILTSIGAAFTVSPVAGDTFTVVASGSTFKCYVNGVLVGTYVDATYQTQTKHGLRATNPAGTPVALWDDFAVAA